MPYLRCFTSPYAYAFILSLVPTTHFTYPNGAVILDFYRAKVVTAGNTENTGTLLAENFS